MNKILLILSMLTLTLLAEKSLTKTITINQMQYPNKTFLEFKDIALEKVKKAAAFEIYGESLTSQTVMVNGKILNDVIAKESGGVIRTRGEVKFKNGVNFGDVVVTIEAYATQKDIDDATAKKNTKKADTSNNIFNSAQEQIKKVKRGFYGSWNGFVMYTNGGSSDINIEITDSGMATINYNSLNCGGSLIIKEKTTSLVKFTQKLTYGQDVCSDKDIVELQKVSDTQLLFVQFDEHKQESARGTLYREE